MESDKHMSMATGDHAVGDHVVTGDSIVLTGEEARVLGCLVEKELTTPDYYPLTMNSLITACNQSSNREPVVSYDETAVNHAIDELREKKLVRWVKEARSRSAKYRHDLESVPGLSVPERSLLAVLLLRGPQTAGELRTRTDRYHDFATLDEVEDTLRSMGAREEPLVERLDRQPGQKEARWRELWNVDRGVDAIPTGASRTAAAPAPSPVAQGVGTEQLLAKIAGLESRLERLERELGLAEPMD